MYVLYSNWHDNNIVDTEYTETPQINKYPFNATPILLRPYSALTQYTPHTTQAHIFYHIQHTIHIHQSPRHRETTHTTILKESVN